MKLDKILQSLNGPNRVHSLRTGHSLGLRAYLGRTVNGQEWLRNAGRHRRNVQNDALLVGGHERQHDLRHLHHRRNVALDDVREQPVAIGHIEETLRIRVADADIVHQNADVQALYFGGDFLVDFRPVAKVNGNGFRANIEL